MATFEVDEEIIIYAFRYALGRKTYAVETTVELLENNWQKLKPATKTLIKEEIKKAIERHIIDNHIDMETWYKIVRLE